ncbi:hypothetical protein PIROE2DRAFT_62676 [Piromyces sp. E2]|nr:hypothetical protein PIROE2DRAFT_62676 [Piromyces sp. E2]|eukprot:OUM61179.1 hypothetical protein PIROE2DRAFT_62676 [Piromyces sp. E2]
MNKEKININQIDFKELKKNLFPLMKLLRKINDGKKKKGLNAPDDIQSIKNKIEFIKKRLREEQEEEEEEEEEEKSITSDSDNSKHNKKKKLKGKSEYHQKKKGKKLVTKADNTEQYLEHIQKRNTRKKKHQKSSSSGSGSNSGNKVIKSMPNPELEKINHWIDMMDFVKYCQQKPYSEAALFPILPLKASEEDELSLFSRLENITEEKM